MKPRMVAVAVVTAGGALLGTAALVGADQGGGGGQISACVQKNSGEVRIPGDGNQCRRSEEQLAWNIEGRPGAAGAEGPAGPQGPAGSPAVGGLSGWERISSPSATLAAGAAKGFVLRCPGAKVVLGGGFNLFPGTGVEVSESRAIDGASGWDPGKTGSGWLVFARNTSATDSSMMLSATCATVG